MPHCDFIHACSRCCGGTPDCPPTGEWSWEEGQGCKGATFQREKRRVQELCRDAAGAAPRRSAPTIAPFFKFLAVAALPESPLHSATALTGPSINTPLVTLLRPATWNGWRYDLACPPAATPGSFDAPPRHSRRFPSTDGGTRNISAAAAASSTPAPCCAACGGTTNSGSASSTTRTSATASVYDTSTSLRSPW